MNVGNYRDVLNVCRTSSSLLNLSGPLLWTLILQQPFIEEARTLLVRPHVCQRFGRPKAPRTGSSKTAPRRAGRRAKRRDAAGVGEILPGEPVGCNHWLLRTFGLLWGRVACTGRLPRHGKEAAFNRGLFSLMLNACRISFGATWQSRYTRTRWCCGGWKSACEPGLSSFQEGTRTAK